MKFLNKETLSAFFAKIAEKEALYLPQKQENGKAAYKEWPLYPLERRRRLFPRA